MAISVASRAHRTIRRLANYSDLTGEHATVPSWIKREIAGEEEPIGLYKNILSDDSYEHVLVTGSGIHIHSDGKWQSFKYDQIRSIDTPESKTEVESLTVHLVDGSAYGIPVRGGEGKHRDAFEFLRFLNRVSVDKK